MQYTKFMNDDDFEDTNLFDSKETEANGTNIDVEEILVSQFPQGMHVWIFIFDNIINFGIFCPQTCIYIYILTFILTFHPTENQEPLVFWYEG